MGIDLSNISSFGCVLMIDEIPQLFIMDDGNLLDGIPFFGGDDEIYTMLYDNELIIVGIIIKDNDGKEILDYGFIDDENYDKLTYIVTPLKFHTLKTPGLTNDDVIDLDFFELMVTSLIDEYLKNLG